MLKLLKRFGSHEVIRSFVHEFENRFRTYAYDHTIMKNFWSSSHEEGPSPHSGLDCFALIWKFKFQSACLSSESTLEIASLNWITRTNRFEFTVTSRFWTNDLAMLPLTLLQAAQNHHMVSLDAFVIFFVSNFCLKFTAVICHNCQLALRIRFHWL